MLLLSSVTLKLRDLAATLVPHLLQFAETGHLRVPPEPEPEDDAVYLDMEDYPGNIDVEAMHILVQYLSNQYLTPAVKQAYDHVVKGLHYDS